MPSKNRRWKVGIAPRSLLTVAVVVEIEKLVAPLGDDTERILEESDDDQETSNGGKVSERCAAHVSCQFQIYTVLVSLELAACHLRLDGLANGVQSILDLAGVWPELVEDAASVGLVRNTNSSDAATSIRTGAANAVT